MGNLPSNLGVQPTNPGNPPTQYIDLSGVFHLQRNYLTGITSQSADPNFATKIGALQNQLDSLHTNFANANVSTSQALDHQTQMMDIVDTEKKRLLMKKQNIDNALETKQRTAILNESYRQRYADYTRMIILFIVFLVLWLGVYIAGNYFPIIPSFVINILMIIIITAGIFTFYFAYLDIAKRDNMYYDQINLDGPTILTPDQIAKKTKEQADAGNLLGSLILAGCIGNDCCSTGTIWDASNSVCVIKTDTTTAAPNVPGANQFTTLSNIYNMDGVKPNSANEIGGYSFV
jgi:hypothetical protein